MYADNENDFNSPLTAEISAIDDLHAQIAHFLKVKKDLERLIDQVGDHNWSHTQYYLEKALDSLLTID